MACKGALLLALLTCLAWRRACASLPTFCTGEEHTCAILDDRSLRCWGANSHGQLGLGDMQDRGAKAGELGERLPPVRLGTNGTVIKVACGSRHTCAVMDNGVAKCWGDNSAGQLGLGRRNPLVGAQPGEMGRDLPAVDLAARAKDVCCGVSHTCAVLHSGGNVKCWGSNRRGQLGPGEDREGVRGFRPSHMGKHLPLVNLGESVAISVSCGGFHTCAVLKDGGVTCWGDNGYGQLGLGHTDNLPPFDELPKLNLGNSFRSSVQSLSCGFTHTCAIASWGGAKCWGFNLGGQLGIGDAKNRGDDRGEMGEDLPLLDLGTGRKLQDVSCGRAHTCAALDDGSTKCWGLNYGAQLGLGRSISYHRGAAHGQMGDHLPTVNLDLQVRAVSAGGAHSCAVLISGDAKCWGQNGHGQLGLGDSTARGDAGSCLGALLPAVHLGADVVATAPVPSSTETSTSTSTSSNATDRGHSSTATTTTWGTLLLLKPRSEEHRDATALAPGQSAEVAEPASNSSEEVSSATTTTTLGPLAPHPARNTTTTLATADGNATVTLTTALTSTTTAEWQPASDGSNHSWKGPSDFSDPWSVLDSSSSSLGNSTEEDRLLPVPALLVPAPPAEQEGGRWRAEEPVLPSLGNLSNASRNSTLAVLNGTREKAIAGGNGSAVALLRWNLSRAGGRPGMGEGLVPWNESLARNDSPLATFMASGEEMRPVEASWHEKGEPNSDPPVFA